MEPHQCSKVTTWQRGNNGSQEQGNIIAIYNCLAYETRMYYILSLIVTTTTMRLLFLHRLVHESALYNCLWGECQCSISIVGLGSKHFD